MATTTRSAQLRETPVICKRCRRTATFAIDQLCECCDAARTPFRDGTDGSYFLLDLDTTSVPVPAFDVNPDDVMAELLNALND